MIRRPAASCRRVRSSQSVAASAAATAAALAMPTLFIRRCWIRRHVTNENEGRTLYSTSCAFCSPSRDPAQGHHHDEKSAGKHVAVRVPRSHHAIQAIAYSNSIAPPKPTAAAALISTHTYVRTLVMPNQPHSWVAASRRSASRRSASRFASSAGAGSCGRPIGCTSQLRAVGST